ncbi:MAG: 30S ribosomal protein S17 [Candidatus Diapherotrites archaeon CG08_land_8_20_14_0_20_34_12]|nr:MAG: 30S ribosomal protein S17 [Candidatus Diapherotrites archaeon CG08_land_8_20_14_0_20_34_12]
MENAHKKKEIAEKKGQTEKVHKEEKKEVKLDLKGCGDRKCPYHGNVSVRGNVFRVTVISAKVPKNAIVTRSLAKYVKKFERYKKMRSRLNVHNPLCINAKVGDIVEIGETRKLSKTKNFVITKIVGREK